MLAFLVLSTAAACHRGAGAGWPGAGAGWPQWRGPTGDGVSRESAWNPAALTGGPRVLWKANVGQGYSSVIISNNRLYTLGWERGKTIFVCLDSKTGNVVWKSTFVEGFDFPQSTPVIDGGRVYGLGMKGRLVCLRAADGSVIWGKDLKTDFGVKKPSYGWATSPVVEGDLLLLNANTAQIAVDKNSGNLRWSVNDVRQSGDPESDATVVVRDLNGSRCALFLGARVLNAVEVSTGKLLWSFTHENTGSATVFCADPVFSDGKVLLTLPGSCALLDTAGSHPTAIWTSRQHGNDYFAPVLVDGYLYGTHLDEIGNSWIEYGRYKLPFRCIEWKTGKIVWEKEGRFTSVTAADDKLIIQELDGTLRVVAADPTSYKELSSCKLEGSLPTAADFATPAVLYGGRIYSRDFVGDLFCVDVSR